jgi:D-aspartate ligase
MSDKKTCALILGGQLNGYSIIRELYENNVEHIVLFDDEKSIASVSNKIKIFKRVKKNRAFLKQALNQLHEIYNYIVIFPTKDLFLEVLSELYDEINEFCFVPVNPKNLSVSIDKYVQYEFCEKLGIPYPKTRSLDFKLGPEITSDLTFPIVIKPARRYVQTPFRAKLLHSETDLTKHKSYFKKLVQEGIKLIASEYIPGDDTSLYFYMAYRSKSGEILNECTFKKLNQVHGPFGVFSSASNECPEIIAEYGKRLFEGMNLIGNCNAEFKYDHIEDDYKLVEINLRSPMVQRIGNKSGVHLQYCVYLDALGSSVPKQSQIKSKIIHLVYMQHEIINLLNRRGYWKYFKHNVFGGDERHFAVFNKSDPMPFVYEFIILGKKLLGFN